MSKQVTTTLEYTPKTRLEFRWEKLDGDEWYCHYELIMPASFDIRSKEGEDGKDGIVRIEMGGTKIGSSGGPLYFYERTKLINTPFCDGAHMIWDMKSLNLRGFVRYEDKINEIVAAIHPNFEEENINNA